MSDGGERLRKYGMFPISSSLHSAAALPSVLSPSLLHPLHEFAQISESSIEELLEIDANPSLWKLDGQTKGVAISRLHIPPAAAAAIINTDTDKSTTIPYYQIRGQGVMVWKLIPKGSTLTPPTSSQHAPPKVIFDYLSDLSQFDVWDGYVHISATLVNF